MCISRNIVFFILVFFQMISFAQSKEDLERQRKKLIQEIEKTNKYLETTAKNKQATLNDLKALSSQVDSRKKLISTISSEISASEKKIISNNKRIDSLSNNLISLNKEYLEIQRYTYLRKLSNNKWSYLLSSGNLNTFLLRWRYVSQFEEFNKVKGIEIISIQNEINNSNKEITKVKQEKGQLLNQEKKEASTLEKEKEAKDKMLRQISAKESQLKQELQKKKSERENLNKAIERVINEQLRKAREMAEARSKSERSDKPLDDAANKLSEEFSQNKNKLPWPLSSGFVSSKFGVQPHPSIKGVNIENNGIDISSKSDRSVNAVFEGEVVGVTKVPGQNYMVILKHGNYYTVYSNLSSVAVRQSAKISFGQNLGVVASDEEGNIELHFEIWKDKSKLNPESWLR